MRKNYQFKLFIDETGTGGVNDLQNNIYILSGCSVNNDDRINFSNWANHIKFKYWNRTDILFHSREIGNKENDFSIFKKNYSKYREFLRDLEDFLLKIEYKMFFVIVDKDKARKMTWNSNKIYSETTKNMIRNFLLALIASDSRGKIVIESSASQQDFCFYKSLKLFLDQGIPEINVNHKKIKKILTSISFVTKNNFDIEEQVADLLAYGAKCKYLDCRKGAYEKMILKVLNNKIFKIPKTKNRKKEYYREINPFMILTDVYKKR